MALSAHWWRKKGILRTYVHPYGEYSIRKHSRGVLRVYLNNEGTVHYGTEDECMKTVQRIINSMEQARDEGSKPVQKLRVQGQGPGDRRGKDAAKRQRKVVQAGSRRQRGEHLDHV